MNPLFHAHIRCENTLKFFSIGYAPLNSCWVVAGMSLPLFQGSWGDNRSTQLLPLAGDETIQMLNKIADQVKAIGHLNRLEKRFSDSGSELFRTITSNDFNSLVLAQPGCYSSDRSSFKQGNRATTFQIDYQHSV